jgi:uncharacterized protein (DUF1697 family)
MTRYVALLRGINVGGNNLIKMTALRACFEKQGFLDVTTYIQSGNVLFSSDQPKREKLCSKIEAAIATTFACRASVVVRSRKELRAVVEGAPRGFGQQPEKFRYDVLFLKEPLTAAAASKLVPTKAGVDQLFTGKGVLYFSRLVEKATQSKLSRVVSLPIYKSMTIRNWNTTTKLLQMSEGSE